MRSRREENATVRSSGLLQNNQAVTIDAHIDVVNQNLEEVVIRMQVLDWGNTVTQTNPVSTLVDVTQVVPGNTRVTFNAAVPSANHYEIRLTVEDPGSENVQITTYGRTALGGGVLNGYTVLNSQFSPLDIDICL
ncbi:hypothetical protein ACAF76_010140 [Brevibacillus sp. TJ4]|uniref:hypothetical protein n=1 Tax=Brevibacillus sp. TJ4 TaxID=3234853 RepID=UPI003BA185B6